MGLTASAFPVSVTPPTAPGAPELDTQLQWVVTADGGSPAPNLSTSDREEANRRYSIIEPLVCPDRFPEIWQRCGGLKTTVRAEIAVQHGVAPKTLQRWESDYREHGMLGLVRRDRADKGIFKSLNKAARDLIFALALPRAGVFGALSRKEIYRAYEDERIWREDKIGQALHGAEAQKYAAHLEDSRLPERLRLPRVSYDVVVEFVNSIPEAVRTLAREGKEAYRNSQEIISHRALTEMAPLDVLVMDDRLLDVFCLIPERGGWKLARPWLCAALDMRTRRFLGWGIFQTPSSDAIATVLKRVFIDHGLPKECYWDNGKTYRSHYLEGCHYRTQDSPAIGDLDPAWRGVLNELGVRVRHALPYNARAKIIEANFTRIANFDKQLPEYCGHKPTARSERFDEMVRQHEQFLKGERAASPFRTVQEIAAIYEDAIANINEQELTGGEGMRTVRVNGYGWMSPAECWEKLIVNVERRCVRTEDIHIVFGRRKELTVKHGEITTTFSGKKVFYRLEGEPTKLMAINGQVVEIGYDPNDLGQVAVYWRGRFIGLGHSVELRKMGTDDFVEDEQLRRKMRREVKNLIRTVHASVPVASPEERLARRRQISPSRTSQGGIEIPAQLPAAVQEASAAVRTDREFRFEDAAELQFVTPTAPTTSEDDGEFHFFRDSGGLD